LPKKTEEDRVVPIKRRIPDEKKGGKKKGKY